MQEPVALDGRPAVGHGDLVTREGGPHDVGAVLAMHARCSEASLYRRFHTPLSHVSDRMARRLLAPPGGWSLVAEGGARVVALACAAPSGRAGVEVGLLVEDAFQQHGVGARLLHRTALDAAARGFLSLHCLTQPGNDRVLRLVRAAGLVGRVSRHDGLVAVEVPLTRLERSLSRPA